MKQSHEVIKDMVDMVGAKKAAAGIGISTSLIYKWCEAPGEDESGARNPLDRITGLMDCCGSDEIIDWLCGQAGGSFVHDPKTGEENIDAEYIAHTQRMLQDFSSLLEVMSKSMADDGRVDEKEAGRIRQKWQKLKRYGEEFVIACEKGVFDETRDE